MRIAQIAPLFEAVPPERYGGTERVVYWLVEELVRRGHEVTLFASGDSRTSAQLVPVVPRALRLDQNIRDPYPLIMLQLGIAMERASEFDIIHSHVDFFTFPFLRLINTPVVTTLHGRLDLLELQPIFEFYKEARLVSISHNQRRPLPHANWVATVYNGIDVGELPLEIRHGEYLAFLGRIAPEKGIEQAVELAKRVDMPLKIAAKVDPKDREYFENEVKHLLNHPLIEYLGEIAQSEKGVFLAKAFALVFPIRWPEPFGLAVAEAMACGTPIITTRYGSMPEIVEHGKTGFLCESVEEMVLAVRQVPEIDRAYCRQCVERRFTARIMADAYEEVYRRVLER